MVMVSYVEPSRHAETNSIALTRKRADIKKIWRYMERVSQGGPKNIFMDTIRKVEFQTKFHFSIFLVSFVMIRQNRSIKDLQYQVCFWCAHGFTLFCISGASFTKPKEYLGQNCICGQKMIFLVTYI